MRKPLLLVMLSAILSNFACAASPGQPDAATSSPKQVTASTSPATTRTSSAAELAAQLRALRDHKASLAKVAHIEIGEPLAERPADFALFGSGSSLTHYSLLKRIKQASDDKDIQALLLTIHADELEMAQAQELRDALLQVRKAGKKTFVYADRYSLSTYTLASGAEHVCMLAGGEMLIPGIAIETMYARGLLDKVGVQADLIQIGEYKGAAESFTRNGPSDEFRAQLNGLVTELYDRVTTEAARNRNLSPDAIRKIVDRAWLPARDAREARLVDHVVDIDGLRELIGSTIGREIDLTPGYGLEEKEDVDLSNPFALLSLLTRKPEVKEEPAIALIYVDGPIMEGSGDDALFESITADGPIRKAMRAAQRDENIKAVVIRINSPGGSALASEAAWQAIRRVAEEKPVIVSIGSMAASGGYYIACAGDYIFADSTAIIGSIGVVGGKVALGGLYEKLGLHSETFSRGANADLFSSSSSFTAEQRDLLNGVMKQTYEQFIDRVMLTRKSRIADIDSVARGRIFAGGKAREVGLIDELGGLQQALDYAANKGGLPKDYEVRILPAPKTLADLLAGDETSAASPVGTRTLGHLELSLLPTPTKRLLTGQLLLIQNVQRGKLLLMPPTTFTVR